MSPAQRLEALAHGQNPLVITQMASGFAVMSESQFLPGYALLLAYPMVEQLLELPESERSAFLNDMARLGEAVKKATGCRRVNFGIYGNLDPFLHAHVWPRYDTERDDLRTIPPLSYPAEIRNDPEVAYDGTKHGELHAQICRILEAD